MPNPLPGVGSSRLQRTNENANNRSSLSRPGGVTRETTVDLQTVPYYIRSTIILLGVTLFIGALYILQGLLIPIAYAVFIAILLFPFDRWLENHHIHRMIS